MSQKIEIGLHNLVRSPGSLQKQKRLGRGAASGHGRTSGRGHKGQKSTKSGNVRPGFEGGQTPLWRRTPKQGFSRAAFVRKQDVIATINVGTLESSFEANSTVNINELALRGLVRLNSKKIKILGEGEISKALTIQAHGFSKNAIEKIEKAGGRIESIGS